MKNDRKDAWWIADYLRIANLPPTDMQLPVLLRLRELTRFRYALVEQVGNLKRKVLSILDRVFPEYETIFSGVFIKSSRTLLKEAVSAIEIADFDLSELTAIRKTTSRGRFGLEKARQIQDLARHITSNPGIGMVTGSAILAEISDINRFESSEKLVAFAGIDPTAVSYTHLTLPTN